MGFKGHFSGADAHTRAATKKQNFLFWLWQWGFTDSAVAGRLWGVGERATRNTLKALLKSGLIKTTYIDGLPVPVFFLSRVGAEVIESYVYEKNENWLQVKPIIFESSINNKQVQHDLLVQRVALDLAGQGDDIQFSNDRFIRAKEIKLFKSNSKIPDAVLRLNENIFYIEIVQSLPKPDELKRLLWLYADRFNTLQTKNKPLFSVVFASTKGWVLEAIENASNEEKIGPWRYDRDKKRWFEMPDSEAGEGVCFITQDFWDCVQLMNLKHYEKSLYPSLLKG